MHPTNRILCVDDNEDICLLLTTILGQSDFEAVCVSDATTALRLMAQERFGLYIIDSQLPGISGLSICQEIRRVDRQTPIIIYSGMAYEADKVAGLLAGADSYLVKPEIGEIVPTVKRLLEQATHH